MRCQAVIGKGVGPRASWSRSFCGLGKKKSGSVPASLSGAKGQKNNTWDSNVVPHRSTNQARRCLTSLSRREAVLSSWYGRSCWQSQSMAFPTAPSFPWNSTGDTKCSHFNLANSKAQRAPIEVLHLNLRATPKPKQRHTQNSGLRATGSGQSPHLVATQPTTHTPTPTFALPLLLTKIHACVHCRAVHAKLCARQQHEHHTGQPTPPPTVSKLGSDQLWLPTFLLDCS